MAKGRKPRSSRRQAKAGEQNPPQPRESRPGESGSDAPTGSSEDVIERIDVLKSQLREARAEAERREQATKQPKPPASPRKGVAAAEGAAVVTAPVGATDRPAVEEEEPGAAAEEGVAETGEETDAADAAEGADVVGGTAADEGAAGPNEGAAGPDEGAAAPAEGVSTAEGAAAPEETRPNTDSAPVAPPAVGASRSTLGMGTIPPRPELRPPYPRPERRARRRIIAVAVLAVLVVAGVVIGVVAGSSGGGSSKQTTIAAYLKAHVPAGTPVALVGPVHYAVPPAYPTVPVGASNLSAAAGVRYAISPDPLASAGPAITSYVLGHATLLVSDRGQASLWALSTGPAAATTTPTTVQHPTGPTPSTPASSLVPGGGPAGTPTPTPTPTPTAAPAPAPAVTAPPASVSTGPPASVSTAPPSSVPPAPAPAPPSPPQAAPTPAGPSPTGAASGTVTVQAGQSFWSIAQGVVQQRLGTAPTVAQVAQYWTSLVAANRGNIPVAGNPNLIYPGTSVVLPAG